MEHTSWNLTPSARRPQIKQVVETVVARLEKRLAKSGRQGGGGGAAAAAVAGKLDKARGARPPLFWVVQHNDEGLFGWIGLYTFVPRAASYPLRHRRGRFTTKPHPKPHLPLLCHVSRANVLENQAWREMYNRPLPSEAKVEEELKKRSLRAAPLSQHGLGTAGPLSGAVMAGGGGPRTTTTTTAASSDLWYASDRPQAAPASRKKRRGSATAAAAAAARKPKRRFVLKAALASGVIPTRPASGSGGGSTTGSRSSQNTAGRKRGRRPNGEAAVKTGDRGRADAAAEGVAGRPVSAAGAREVGALAGTNSASAAASVVQSPILHGGTECGNGGGGGGSGSWNGREVAAGGRHAATEGTGGGEEYRQPRATGDPIIPHLQPTPASFSAAASAFPQAAGGEEVANSQPKSNSGAGNGDKPPQPVESGAAAGSSSGRPPDQDQLAGAGAGEARLGATGGGSRSGVGVERMGGGAGAERPASGGEEEEEGTAKMSINREDSSDPNKSGSAAAAAVSEVPTADTGEATTAVPDVVVTANFVGEFLKESRRKTWRLDLEGGVVEGRGQVFVFDECECWLTPPG